MSSTESPGPGIDPEITKRLPHRPPMLLLEQLVAEDDNSIHCRKTFRGDEFFVQGHYPDYPIVPGVILCECGAQAGAMFLAKKLAADTEGVPVLTRLGDARFKQMVRPGDTVDIHVHLDEQLSQAFFMTAKVLVNGKSAVRFQFACTIAPAA